MTPSFLGKREGSARIQPHARQLILKLLSSRRWHRNSSSASYVLVQSRRNKKAAKQFFRKLLKGLTYVPRVVITDKLKSYGAAKREILPGVEHRQSRYLNNRCENSH
jgi:hypothetical protein